MCTDKSTVVKNYVETGALILGSILGTVWLLFSFSADKPLLQSFVTKSLSVDGYIENQGLLATEPPAQAIDVVVDVNNNGKGSMFVLSAFYRVWGIKVKHIENDKNTFISTMNDQLFTKMTGPSRRDYNLESSLISAAEVFSDWTLENGEPIKRRDTLYIPCGDYDALYAEINVISKPTSKSFLVLDDPSKEIYSGHWVVLSKDHVNYVLSRREENDRARVDHLFVAMHDKKYQDMNSEQLITLIDEQNQILKNNGYIVVNKKQLEGMDKSKLETKIENLFVTLQTEQQQIWDAEDIRMYDYSFSFPLQRSSADSCQLVADHHDTSIRAPAS